MECSNFVTNGNKNRQGNNNHKDKWMSLGLLQADDENLEEDFFDDKNFHTQGIFSNFYSNVSELNNSA